MLPKYQIFVSSTYEDLRAEREAVTKAILEMGHIPVGMEMFSAADEEQWQLIARQIEASDYYVVVIAHRYGSMDGSISYTEKEYDHAVAVAVPVLAFLIDDAAPWPGDRQDAVKDKLEAFKVKARRKPVSFWKSADDLNARVLAALSKAFHSSPRRGWLPADQLADPKVAEEVSRLSKENAELRNKVTTLEQDLHSRANRLNLRPLESAFQVIGTGERMGISKTWKVNATWAELFAAVAPSLMQTQSDISVCAKLGELLMPPQMEGTRLSNVRIEQTCFETVRIQLMALGLVSVRELTTTANTRALFWNLTEAGFAKMIEFRALTNESSGAEGAS